MNGRDEEIRHFLAGTGWAQAALEPVAGDASSRRFWRLTGSAGSAVLIDDPGEGGGSAARHVEMAQWLRSCGYGAAATLAADITRGLVLCEDLGTDIVSRLLTTAPGFEEPVYRTAVEFLADLHGRAPPDGLGRLDGPGLAKLTDLLDEWYLPGAGRVPDPAGRFGTAIEAAWSRLQPEALVASLRDFHAENLIWRADRPGLGRLGLVDYQDAVLAHPAYDLVSLLQDARRDVSEALEQAMIDHYLRLRRVDPKEFRPAYALMGAQRALRIVAVFARLALRDGKTRYLDLMPRVWDHLQRNLRDPSLAALRAVTDESLPLPDRRLRARLVDHAGRHPSAAMIFAAGFGTRMGPLTAARPKPLIEVNGRPLLDHAIDLTRAAGVDRVVVNVHYLDDMIRSHLAGLDVPTAVSDESDRILETGGGLKHAVPLLGRGPVFTLNSDAVWTGPGPLLSLRAAWEPEEMGALLLLVPLSRAWGHTGRGDFSLGPGGRVTRGGDLVYTGVQIVSTDTVLAESETVFSMNRIWDRLAAEGRLYGVVHPGGWCDVGQPSSIAVAEELLGKDRAKELHAV